MAQKRKVRIKGAPWKIYLQVGPECPDGVRFDDLSEVTHAAKRVFDTDIAYIRLDVHDRVCDQLAEDYQSMARWMDEEATKRDRAVELLKKVLSAWRSRIVQLHPQFLSRVCEIVREHTADRLAQRPPGKQDSTDCEQSVAPKHGAEHHSAAAAEVVAREGGTDG